MNRLRAVEGNPVRSKLVKTTFVHDRLDVVVVDDNKGGLARAVPSRDARFTGAEIADLSVKGASA